MAQGVLAFLPYSWLTVLNPATNLSSVGAFLIVPTH